MLSTSSLQAHQHNIIVITTINPIAIIIIINTIITTNTIITINTIIIIIMARNKQAFTYCVFPAIAASKAGKGGMFDKVHIRETFNARRAV